MDDKKLSNLISGLTGGTPPAKETRPAQDVEQEKGKENTARQMEERFCTIVSSQQLGKLRIIARREGLTIKQVVGAAFSKAIASYELRHGPIDPDAKSDPYNLF